MSDIDKDLFVALEEEGTGSEFKKAEKELEKGVDTAAPVDNGSTDGVDKQDLQIGPDAEKATDVGEGDPEPEEEVKAEMARFEYLSEL